MSDTPDKAYQVLARKYRPETFADLVGQEAMVRTLKNAFEADRIAQAFIMTGIRGTGKTTTARIIAKGMNCIGPEGEGGTVAADPKIWGDVVLGRRDTPTSYHMAVVMDDALQGITHVVRGQDLFHATGVHILLQSLLGLSQPVYHHHNLILDEDGRKLSKSRGDTSLQSLRNAGMTPADIMRMVGLEPG